MHIYYSHPAGKIEKKFLQYIKVFAEPKDQEHLEALEKRPSKASSSQSLESM